MDIPTVTIVIKVTIGYNPLGASDPLGDTQGVAHGINPGAVGNEPVIFEFQGAELVPAVRNL